MLASARRSSAAPAVGGAARAASSAGRNLDTTHPMPPARSRRSIRRAAAALAFAIAAAPALAQQSPPPLGIPVQAEPALRQDIPIVLRNIGTVQANQSVLLRARVDGAIQKIFFREGQEVKAGDQLVLIDPRPYAASLAQAEAARKGDESMLANARRDQERYANLAHSDFASRQQVDTQNAAVGRDLALIDSDAAAIETARLNLAYCTITAPIDGVVGLRLIDLGNMIRAADATGIVTINQVHPITVVFTLPQDALPLVQAAMARGAVPVQAYAPDDRTLLSEGRLLTFDNAIDAATGTIKLKAEFANEDNHLWPGQFVNARVRVDVLRDAVTVPTVAVQRGPAGLFVYVVKPDGGVHMQPVRLRADDGAIAAIAEGLAAGAIVVTNGMSRLQEGSQVAVAPKTAS
jgi:multidrug efflux system membrane fusion protein